MAVPISCSACASVLRIPDELYAKRFAGRITRLRCKKCGAVVSVDGTVRSEAADTESFEWDLEAPAAAPPKVPSVSSAKQAAENEKPAAPPRPNPVCPPPEAPTPALLPERKTSAPSLRAMTIPLASAEPSPPTPLPAKPELATLPETKTEAKPEPLDLTPPPVPTSAPLSAAPPPRQRLAAALLIAVGAVVSSFGFFAQRLAPAEPARSATVAHVERAIVPAPIETQAHEPGIPPEPSAELALPAPKPIAQAPVATETSSAKPPHDEQALQLALRWSLAKAEDCHRTGRATGTSRVVVRFAPSGRVSAASIDNPTIASAPVGRCVLSYLKAMRIPAFEAEELEVVREIQLR